ncbi:MAG: hypothetical protein ISN29_01960 [Gammaproteobacteria bacterium AqS3]|nr:hypothetical protein [Gammaproteobacteria bacterium AqS3]
MNNDEVCEWLDKQWLHILNDSDRKIDPEIDALVNLGCQKFFNSCCGSLGY